MRMRTPSLGALFILALLLSGCGKKSDGESCNGPNCSERSINAPVKPPGPLPPEEPPPPTKPGGYVLPEFQSAWGLSRAIYGKAEDKYRRFSRRVPNQRFFVVVDFSQHSSRRRFFLFDLETGSVERYHVAHGSGSDPDKTGWPSLFANTPESKKSSLGLYLTLGTYYGKHGNSLRLRGLEGTNSNAESRAIVVHAADYVSEAQSYAGRSWGCPALDPSVAPKVIRRIKLGALLLIAR